MISGKKVLNLPPHQLLACNNFSVMVIVVHDTYKTCLEKYLTHQFSSVQFSHSVVYNSLRSHEPQHTRPPCPSPTPRVHPNTCPSTISSSVVPFSSCLQSLPASGSSSCLHYCPANRLISTIFLDSIYICVCVCVCLKFILMVYIAMDPLKEG